MEILQTKNLDHLGIVMGTLKKFSVIDFVNQKLGHNEQHHVSAGEVLAAMVLNGLGFVSRPLSLTPQFFETKALDVLFGREIQPDKLNRHRLGRVLDDIHGYGCELLYSEIALHICEQIELQQKFTSLDTTSFSVSGEYDVDSDEKTINVSRGYSKDHRPDLKQVVLELVTSHDGGLPLMMQCFDGNASDTKIFKTRCEQLIKSFKQAEGPHYLVGDSKLYCAENAAQLRQLKFITRIPRTYKDERAAVDIAIAENRWINAGVGEKYHVHIIEHLGIEQRWLVIHSESAKARSEKTLDKQIKKEILAINPALMHLRNKTFSCEIDAINAIKTLSASFKYHDLSIDKLIKKECYAGVGRPKKGEKPTGIIYQVIGESKKLDSVRQTLLTQRSCYIIGTNTTTDELTNEEVLEAYKNQNASVERGFRFLKDPQFFVSSFFVKKPSRIMSLLMIMTLSLLIYSVTQKHLREQLLLLDETLPNQINKPIKNPTMRWVFQIMEGIHVVYVRINAVITKHFTGINDLKRKIIRFFFHDVHLIYDIGNDK